MKKKIKDYDNYEIYDNGDVLNISTQKILAGSIRENGYKYYRLSKEGQKKMFYAHRLVAEHFLENSENLPVVNHKDGDKLNNSLSNLRYISLSENVLSALYDSNTNNSNKPVEQYDLQGNFIKSFPSVREAARQLNLDSSTISKVCRGKNKTHGDFIFKYSN